MKILYHHRTRSKDGQFVHIVELTGALRALGHEIVMVGPATAEQEEFGAGGGLIARAKSLLPSAIYELGEFAYSWIAYRRLVRAYLEHRPDCLYERYNLFQPSCLWFKRRFDLPVLLEINAPLAEERRVFGKLALRRLARWTERAVWRGVDRALPVTDTLADHIRAAGVPEERIAVIPNGVDLARFNEKLDKAAAKKRIGVESNLVIGFNGFVRSWHRLDRVVDFVADHGTEFDAKFVVIGEGPAKTEIEQYARTRGVANAVIFLGLVDRDRIADCLAAFDIAVQPDVTAYASPLKLFEYMALGCAIVAPSKPNIREVLADGKSAVLFDPESPNGFGDALTDLCSDAELRARVGAGARQLIGDRGYTWERNAQRVVKLFRDLGVK